LKLRIKIADLQPRDIISLNGRTTHRVVEMQYIGAGLYQITYSSTTNRRGYQSIKKGSELIIVAPVGRHYTFLPSGLGVTKM
jgi:hypothetical protein